ncbi:hypothetical protein ACQ4PT_054974 [Festuca glaucescens]
MVEPSPPPQAMALWREQVHDFLTGPLQSNVVNSQPSLFGVGLFHMCSPNSVNALVQHGQFQIQNRLLRFVHVGEAPQNHHAVIGFRRGWLMFLGVHPDYRNDFDIANAVATFGQYHTWNSNDPVTDRVLVYASLPSPQLVPRDVVFRKFALVGGVKESWTAPVYILMADFADALPDDEDQMPPDGNPHPFPGELQLNNNLFVNPQFPEIGWDVVENMGHDQQGAHDGDGNWNQPEEVPDVMQEVQESMVINLSDSSGSSVNMMDVQPQQQGNVQLLLDVLNVGMVRTVIGPVLPPDMLWARAFELVLPSLYGKFVPAAMSASPFAFLKANSGFPLSGISDDQEYDKQSLVQQRPRLLTLSDTAKEVMVNDEENIGQTVITVVLEDLPVAAAIRKKRARKVDAPLVQSTERRFTRSCLKMDGYRPKPVLVVQPKIRNKTRAKCLLVSLEKEAQHQEQMEEQSDEEQDQVPITPISVMQRVGLALGIAPEKLSKEQLEAAPADKEEKKSPDD